MGLNSGCSREGPAGDPRNKLDSLSAFEGIKFLTGCRRRLYFKIRNTIEHRAHRLDYQKEAERMLSPENRISVTSNDYLLLPGVLSIYYQNWGSGRGVNL